MKKIKLYIVSKASLDASKEEFDKNIVTILSNKKHFREFAFNKCIQEHSNHYNRWRELKELEDNMTNRLVYLRDCVDFNKYLNQFVVRTQIYTQDDIASIFRLTMNCIPTLSSYETEQEYKAWQQIDELMKKLGLDNMGKEDE